MVVTEAEFAAAFGLDSPAPEASSDQVTETAGRDMGPADAAAEPEA